MTIKNIFDKFDQLVNSPDVQCRKKPDFDWFRENWDRANIDAMKEIFKLQFGYDCPEQYVQFFNVPADFHISWRSGEIGGELFFRDCITMFSEPMGSDFRHLDIQNKSIYQFCIFDQILDNIGPYYIIFDPIEQSSQLFLFDMRDLYPIKLTINEYLDHTAKLCSINYWQLLFTDKILTPDVSEHLRDCLNWIGSRFPNADDSQYLRILDAK